MADRDDCHTFLSVCVLTVWFVSYLISSALLFGQAEHAVEVADTLNPSCVLGNKFDVVDGNIKYAAAVRMRDDAGLLYAKWMLGDGTEDDAARELIASQSTTLRNWTHTVSQGAVLLDGDAGEFPVWEYPIDVFPTGGSSLDGRIAVVGNLPAGALWTGDPEGRGVYSRTEMDYCDADATRDNVWHETAPWFARGSLRLAQAGIVVGASTLAAAFVLVAAVLSDGTACSKIMALVGSCCWILLTGPVIAFFYLGGTGAVELDQRTESEWENNLARDSPQTKQAYSRARTCYFGFVAFAVTLPIIYCLVVAFVAGEMSERVRDLFRRRAGAQPAVAA